MMLIGSEMDEKVVNKIIETIEISAVSYSLITNNKIDVEYSKNENANFIGIWENKGNLELVSLNCTIEYVRRVTKSSYYKLTDKNFKVYSFYTHEELLSFLINDFNFDNF